MRKISKEELEKILADHKEWLADPSKDKRADLREADLRWADLRWADLSGAYLRGADLHWTIGDSREIKTLQLPKYHVVVTKNEIVIGCQQHLAKEWYKFTDEQISRMDKGALDWWNEWKSTIFKVHATFFKNM